MKKFIVIATFAVILASCSTAAEETGTTSLQTGEVKPVYMTEVNVSGTDFAFTPNKILGHVGEKIVINFKNDSEHMHNFVIPDLNITTETLKPGETEAVEITPEAAGTFKIICSIASHEEQGMFGEFIVK